MTALTGLMAGKNSLTSHDFRLKCLSGSCPMNANNIKKISLCFIIMALITGCAGSRNIPDWNYAAFNRLEDFKQAALEGRTTIAEPPR